MKIKNILLASMITGASLMMASSAYAATTTKTEAVTLKSDLANGYNAHFGSDFTSAQTNFSFIDKFTFSLNTGYDSSASLTSTYLDSSTIKDLKITSFNLVKYDPTDITHILATYVGLNKSGTDADAIDVWSLRTKGLTAGSYYVEVGGDILGSGGGTYGTDLTIAIAVAPVPEPATYGMMAAGLGLLGFVARRKKAKQA